VSSAIRVVTVVYWVVGYFSTVLIVQCVSDTSSTSVLLSWRNYISSSLWCSNPLAFHSAMRKVLMSIVEFVVKNSCNHA